MKLLIIGGGHAYATRTKHALVEYAHVVDFSPDRRSGLDLATVGSYDLLLLRDLLPDASAESMLQALRGTARALILLTGNRQAPDERARMLRAGADDYLLEPFSMSELVARVHALCRRASHSLEVLDRITVGDLEIDLMRRHAWREGRSLQLTAQEFKLLAFMVRHRGSVIARAVLREQLWEEEFDSDTNVVDVAIRRLRSKVDQPFKSKLLHTVRGAGYVLDERIDRRVVDG